MRLKRSTLPTDQTKKYMHRGEKSYLQRTDTCVSMLLPGIQQLAVQATVRGVEMEVAK